MAFNRIKNGRFFGTTSTFLEIQKILRLKDVHHDINLKETHYANFQVHTFILG